MSNEQILLYEDSKSESIVRFICKKRDISEFEQHYCLAPIQRMRFDSINKGVLKYGNGTTIVSELRRIYNNLDNNPVINFSRVLDLFDIEKTPSEIIKETTKCFLSLYDITKESELSKNDWIDLVNGSMKNKHLNTSFFRNEHNEVCSLKPNSIALKNINLRNYQKRK